MTQISLKVNGKEYSRVTLDDLWTIYDGIKDFRDAVYIVSNGKSVSRYDEPAPGSICHLVPRVLGGKGGFGSMLRAIGAQIEKTTSREACRDLSGRRMRDVNNEKKLKEWISKQSEREEEKARKKRERRERRRAQPHHMFSDPQYEQQKSKARDNLEDALQQGLKKATGKGASSTATLTSEKSRKRKSDEDTPVDKKRATEWLGIDMDDSDLDSSEGESGSSDGESSEKPEAMGESSCGAEGPSCSYTYTEPPDTTSTDSSSNDTNQESEDSQDVNNIISVKSSINDEVTLTDEVTSMDTVTANIVEPDTVATTGAKDITEQQDESSTEAPPSSSTNDEKENIPDKNDVKEEKTTEPLMATEAKQSESDNLGINLDKYASPAELEELGLDKLKHELLLKGVKCGGTLQERAKRLFSVKGLSVDQIPASIKAKPAKGKK